MYGYFWQDFFPMLIPFDEEYSFSWENDEKEQEYIDDYFWWQERNKIPPAYRVFYIGHIWRS